MTVPTPRARDRVVLIGFMGAGKSTVGRLLAGRLKWTFVDTDAAIEDESGATIARLFEREGEDAFREREARAVARSLASSSVVVAVGGGAITRPDVRATLWSQACVVYLEANVDSLERRLADDDSAARPLARGRFPAELLRRRLTYYKDAHRTEPTDGRPADDVAASIARWLTP